MHTCLHTFETKNDVGSEEWSPSRQRSTKLRRSLDGLHRKPPPTPPQPSTPQQEQHQGGFLRQLYETRFPLDCKNFCNLVLVAVRAQPTSTSTTNQRNSSPGVSVTEILHVFSTACGLPLGQTTTNRCMSFVEFERGLVAVARIVYQSQARSFLLFHDSVLLPFAYNLGVIPMASFHPVVLTWIRRPDVHAVLNKLFATCTQKTRAHVVQVGELEKVLLSLRMYPAQVSRRKLRHCFRSVLLACTLVKRIPTNKSQRENSPDTASFRQRSRRRSLHDQHYPHTPIEKTASKNTNQPEGLTFPGMVECLCRCVSASTTAHKNRKMAIHDLSAIASTLQLIGCAYCLKHGISFNFVARLELDKAVRIAAGCIDLKSQLPCSPRHGNNLERGDAVADPETLRKLLRKMQSSPRDNTPPRPRSSRSLKNNSNISNVPQTPAQRKSKRRSSTGNTLKTFRDDDGLTVAKSEYDMVVAKLHALEQALDMDLGKVDWDGTLDDAEAKMQATVPRLMSDDPEEQAAAQEEFEMLDKIIRNHTDYKEREKLKSEEWEEENREKNIAALDHFKRLFPPTITSGGVTQAELVLNHNLSAALARRLFSSKVLRFVHMESEMISKIHIADLTGTYSTQGLDIKETRAIYACLPETFQSDDGGRKDAWRCTLRETLKSLCDKEAKEQLTANQREHSAYRPVVASKFKHKQVAENNGEKDVKAVSAGSAAPMSLMDAIAARKTKVGGGEEKTGGAPQSLMAAIAARKEKGEGRRVAGGNPDGAPQSLMAAIAARRTKVDSDSDNPSIKSSTKVNEPAAAPGAGAGGDPQSLTAAISARRTQIDGEKPNENKDKIEYDSVNKNAIAINMGQHSMLRSTTNKVIRDTEVNTNNTNTNQPKRAALATDPVTYVETTRKSPSNTENDDVNIAAVPSSADTRDPALNNGRNINTATSEMRSHNQDPRHVSPDIQRRLVFDSQDPIDRITSGDVARHSIIDTHSISTPSSCALVEHCTQRIDSADSPTLGTKIQAHVSRAVPGNSGPHGGSGDEMIPVRSRSSIDIVLRTTTRNRGPPQCAPTLMGALRAALRVRRVEVDSAAGDIEGLAEVAAAERAAAVAEARRVCPPSGGSIKAIAREVAKARVAVVDETGKGMHVGWSDSCESAGVASTESVGVRRVMSTVPVDASATAVDVDTVPGRIRRSKSLSLVDELASVLARRRDMDHDVTR